MAYRDEVLADSPVVYLELEQTSGNPTNSGSASLTYTLGSGITKTATGKEGNAWTFDGTANGYIFVDGVATSVYTDGVFSAEWWVKTTDSNQVISYFNQVGSGGYVQFNVNSSGKALVSAWVSSPVVNLTSTTTINNGSWHHIVYTQNGNDKKLYVNGTMEASSTTALGTWNPTTSRWSLGLSSSSGAAVTVDEFAAYTTELSGARISQHYSPVLNGGYTAQAMTASGYLPWSVTITATPMTATAELPNATGAGIRNVNYSASAMTASADTGNHSNSPRTEKNAVTADASIFDDAPTTVFNGDVTRIQKDGSGLDSFLFKLDNPMPGSTLVSVKIRLKGQASSTGTFTPEIYRITGTWSESTVTYNTAPAMTVVGTQPTATSAAGVDTVIDLTAAYNAGYTNGIAIKSSTTGAAYYYTKEAASSPNRPVVEWLFSTVNVDATVPAEPMTASASMPEPSVSVAVDFHASPMTASALMPDHTVTVVSNIDVPADPMTATATLSGAFSLPVDVPADAMTASGELVDPAVSTTQGVRFEAEPMTANGVIKTATHVNGNIISIDEGADRYFQRVMAMNPKDYFRVRENAGSSIAINRMAPEGLGLIYNNVMTGRFEAPEGRNSIYFSGNSMIEQAEPITDELVTINVSGGTQYVPATFEFSLRTEKQDTFIMAGSDRVTGIAIGPRLNLREMSLVGGKVNMKEYIVGAGYTYFDPNTGSYRTVPSTEVNREFTGVRNIADGQWHHIIVRSVVEPYRGSSGIEVWIDGTFEVRRYDFSLGFGVPDYIGMRPQGVDTFTMPVLPSSKNFVGEMSEMAYYPNINMTSRDISLNHAAFMGYVPIEVAPMEATATMPEASGRGNQKRALFLVWNLFNEVADPYNPGGSIADTMEFNPILYPPVDTSITNPPQEMKPFNHAGYKVFPKSVVNKTRGTAYYDDVTDNRRLIDLTKDVNLDEYDLIFFKDWPDESVETDALAAAFPDWVPLREKLVAQVRSAVDDGISLHVGNPRLAAELGIIDRYEFCPSVSDYVSDAIRKTIDGAFYDYGSALHFPWNIAGFNMASTDWLGLGNGETQNVDPAYLRLKARYYGDTHKNNRFRVRALIDGLTDIPSKMIDEAIFTTSGAADFDDTLPAYKYLDRESGLLIGDEFIYNGTDLGVLAERSEDFNRRFFYRYYGAFATPIANVLAGTVVTTFGEKEWVGETERLNPYRDYATSIAIEPGQLLNGTPVGGRIFVDFTEMPSSGYELMPKQVLPNEWPVFLEEESAEQKEWDYSFTRLSRQQITLGGNQGVVVVDSAGNVINVGGSPSGANLPVTNYSSLFPIEFIGVMPMYARGFFWLADVEEEVPGSETVRATPMTATGEFPEPTISTQKSTVVTAQPMRANGSMPKVAEDTSGDVDVLVFPMTAEGRIPPIGKTVYAAPMTGTAELVQPSGIAATGEDIVLYVHSRPITLYLKEEV